MRISVFFPILFFRKWKSSWPFYSSANFGWEVHNSWAVHVKTIYLILHCLLYTNFLHTTNSFLYPGNYAAVPVGHILHPVVRIIRRVKEALCSKGHISNISNTSCVAGVNSRNGKGNYKFKNNGWVQKEGIRCWCILVLLGFIPSQYVSLYSIRPCPFNTSITPHFHQHHRNT